MKCLLNACVGWGEEKVPPPTLCTLLPGFRESKVPGCDRRDKAGEQVKARMYLCVCGGGTERDCSETLDS